MTDTNASPPAGARATSSSRPRSEPTGWVGWIVFAAVMMIIVGILQAIEGFVAIFKDSYYLVPKSGLVVTVDYTAWGWIHLILGILVAGAGYALFSGRMWARTVGVIAAFLSLLANFSFVSAYPVWAIILITVDVLIIYALTVHGREMQDF
ncbi:MAG: DUF7144 family membrane protein [Kineosporiaceae bacterium]